MRKFLIIFILSFVFFFFFISWITPCYKNGLFEVEQGQGLCQIAENLKKQGFIQMEFPFYSYVLLKGKSQNLKSGVYLFTAYDTFLSIAEKIISDEAIKMKITIIEGWKIIDIGGYLEDKGIVSRAKHFYGLGSELRNKDFSLDFVFLEDVNIKGVMGLEGFLFPDTYEINPGMGITKIVEKMLNNFDKKLTLEIRQEIEKQNKTIFDIVTMASLIEKEVKTKQDKELVSGILWKRLEINMPLQVDCELKTYENLGLPIGPICNPGLKSIIAAIEPKHSEYLYYLSTPEGETIFSKTLEEHNIAKAKYLK
ncbi:endolytic transglycosylase MltG [Candidatus Parcubacteria bacterium]|nr:endolytic transglycosylase MltG [Candidatus Parcubacteria bacterium]